MNPALPDRAMDERPTAGALPAVAEPARRPGRAPADSGGENSSDVFAPERRSSIARGGNPG